MVRIIVLQTHSRRECSPFHSLAVVPTRILHVTSDHTHARQPQLRQRGPEREDAPRFS
jgi:hypothetical protein